MNSYLPALLCVLIQVFSNVLHHHNDHAKGHAHPYKWFDKFAENVYKLINHKALQLVNQMSNSLVLISHYQSHKYVGITYVLLHSQTQKKFYT